MEPLAPQTPDPRPVDRLAALRRSYVLGTLDPADVDPDPVAQLRRWLDDAQDAGLVEPNAMVLATVDADGAPAARTVLCKGIDERGLVFYTQVRSAKGRQLAVHPEAAAVFVWHAMDRQAIVRGAVTPVSRAEVAAYFASRPRGSQLAAWASDQSAVVASRAELEADYAAAERRFAGEDVPMPEHWTGYRLALGTVELWQGRRDRLHDRVRYRPLGHGWVVERLAP
ncbi:pyridoxamine 5'-phosphate oxidase [Actinotalea sp. M2MS4P-6]|uniref:pyridoxamine 5'-phosphate oxidase n=1 Tax=Actinotalea sp. M2MS4P-6 TaxID=2983762 RepID=UPI0021E49DEE|nr:pyridoxamine 5'-phosphate oxidase [Actinotalea sp. M2MS4P-6]MCV2394076.1 pyridoxamine 5'-phosphate oxidase [Actinotalea sp. M2MS4P-6]